MLRNSRFAPLGIALLLSCWIQNEGRGQIVYSGVWAPGSDGYALWVTSDWSNFQSQWGNYENNGLRMVDFEAYVSGSTVTYAGVFRSGTFARAAWITPDWRGFQAKWREFENAGLRMVDFETYSVNGTRWYAGVFHAGTGARAAWITSDWSNFTSKWSAFEAEGLRLIDYETYVEDGVRWYAGIFRPGPAARAAWITSDWDSFTSKWAEFSAAGLRMVDYETYMVGNTRWFAGIYHGGSGGHYAWFGVDFENFVGKWSELAQQNLRLIDIELSPGNCSNECSNQVVMPVSASANLYNYGVTGGDLHCEGEPEDCPTFSPGDQVVYRQPVNVIGGVRYVRHSAINIRDQIFTLPFSDTTGMGHNGWLYSPGNWHHAIDYWKDGGSSTFRVRAAAPGRVIHIGWDNWSGGTIVVSHDVGGDTDRYRTIYMHLRNGPDNDCNAAWNMTVPSLAEPRRSQYTNYLNATGCTSDPNTRNLDSTRWGSDGEQVDMNLLGKTVQRGEFLAWAGNTGPGGCGCIPNGTGPNIHLHIFFAHRDPEDDQWYFFDPYGMYAPSDCYPSGMEDSLDSCARYPIAWRDGRPQLSPAPSTLVMRGDSNSDGVINLTDAVATLRCLFSGGDCSDCADAADANDSGSLNMTDAIYTLRCLFGGARGCRLQCEVDSTPDRLGCQRSNASCATRVAG